jgi:hypothetical protein
LDPVEPFDASTRTSSGFFSVNNGLDISADIIYNIKI